MRGAVPLVFAAAVLVALSAVSAASFSGLKAPAGQFVGRVTAASSRPPSPNHISDQKSARTATDPDAALMTTCEFENAPGLEERKTNGDGRSLVGPYKSWYDPVGLGKVPIQYFSGNLPAGISAADLPAAIKSAHAYWEKADPAILPVSITRSLASGPALDSLIRYIHDQIAATARPGGGEFSFDFDGTQAPLRPIPVILFGDPTKLNPYASPDDIYSLVVWSNPTDPSRNAFILVINQKYPYYTVPSPPLLTACDPTHANALYLPRIIAEGLGDILGLGYAPDPANQYDYTNRFSTVMGQVFYGATLGTAPYPADADAVQGRVVPSTSKYKATIITDYRVNGALPLPSDLSAKLKAILTAPASASADKTALKKKPPKNPPAPPSPPRPPVQSPQIADLGYDTCLERFLPPNSPMLHSAYKLMPEDKRPLPSFTTKGYVNRLRFLTLATNTIPATVKRDASNDVTAVLREAWKTWQRVIPELGFEPNIGSSGGQIRDDPVIITDDDSDDLIAVGTPDGKNVIAWANFEKNPAFASFKGLWAVTITYDGTQERDIYLNTAILDWHLTPYQGSYHEDGTYAENGCTGQYGMDTSETMVHEFGHAIGLDHTAPFGPYPLPEADRREILRLVKTYGASIYDTTMFAVGFPKSLKRGKTTLGDEEGAHALAGDEISSETASLFEPAPIAPPDAIAVPGAPSAPANPELSAAFNLAVDANGRPITSVGAIWEVYAFNAASSRISPVWVSTLASLPRRAFADKITVDAANGVFIGPLRGKTQLPSPGVYLWHVRETAKDANGKLLWSDFSDLDAFRVQ